MAEQVVTAARLVLRETGATIELALDPPGLGRLRLTGVLEGGQLSLVLAPERLAACEPLRAAMQEIQALLAARGLAAALTLQPPAADAPPAPRREFERAPRREPDPRPTPGRRREGGRLRASLVDVVA
jgi:hypothetical protein